MERLVEAFADWKVFQTQIFSFQLCGWKNLHVKYIRLNYKRIHVFRSVKKKKKTLISFFFC